MYCSHCGTQIADDASFCYKCGKQQKAPTQPTQSKPVQWETCEIHYEVAKPGFSVIPVTYRLIAYAVGPTGRRKIVGPEFLLPMSKEITYDVAYQFGDDALNLFVQSLTQEGWQPIHRGQYWFSQRFQRVYDPVAIDQANKIKARALLDY